MKGRDCYLCASHAFVTLICSAPIFCPAFGEVVEGRKYDTINGLPPVIRNLYPTLNCVESNNGFAFYSVGRTVYRVPIPKMGVFINDHDSKLSSRDLSLKPSPPNPHDAPGCPGNPASGFPDFTSVFPPPFRTVETPTVKAGILVSARHINVSLFDSKADPTTLDLRHGLEKCEKDENNLIEESYGGLKRCRLPYLKWPGDTNNTHDNAEAFYFTKDYSFPDGEKFIIHCDHHVFKYQYFTCLTSYEWLPGLLLTYNFSPTAPPGEGSVLPLEQVIQFDKDLRQFLINSVVYNYPWKD